MMEAVRTKTRLHGATTQKTDNNLSVSISLFFSTASNRQAMYLMSRKSKLLVQNIQIIKRSLVIFCCRMETRDAETMYLADRFLYLREVALYVMNEIPYVIHKYLLTTNSDIIWALTVCVVAITPRCVCVFPKPLWVQWTVCSGDELSRCRSPL
jgi:hypothetical protein